ncbi:MAG: DctP family TRAP transporter solute-binding subunit [Thermodesulfobacteriota bacterium]
MKKILVASLFMLLSVLLVIPAALAKEIQIRFSHVVAENTPKGWAAKEFASRVNKELKGKVKVAVFPNSQLYDDNQAVEALSAGFIEMVAPSSAKFVGSVPQLQVFDEPFLFATVKACHDTIDGPIGQEIFAMLDKRGLKPLAFWDNGFKHFSNNVRPLIKPEDFKGVKFRIMSSDILEAQMKLLGAVGLKLPFSEVYNALEQGVVDGQENTASNIYSKKFHEVQKYMSISNHGYIGYLVTTSSKFWNGLPADIRTKLEQIMKEVTMAERNMAMELNNKQMALIKEYAKKSGKLQIHELNDQEMAAMQKALEPVHKKMPDIIPVSWIDQIYQMK